MPTTQQSHLIRVAVTGPMRQSYTYEAPPHLLRLTPGQRVLVPFGNRRITGYYLGPSTEPPPSGVAIKPILRVLDAESLFSKEHFEFCLWMADYYFANPADCLAASLPAAVKSATDARYLWADVPAERVPDFLQRRHKPGKNLSKILVAEMRKRDARLLANLLRDGVVTQYWPSPGEKAGGKLIGFRAANESLWAEFFEKRSINPEPFFGTKTRNDLKAEGWTEHFIRSAQKVGLLEPVMREGIEAVLDFITPRSDVLDIALNKHQQDVVSKLCAKAANGFSVSLIHGVTGSGKTIVYCHVAQTVVDAGKQVLVLTPEIALAGATLSYLRGFFGDAVTVVHSAMSNQERLESFNGIREGKYQVIVGPRSALLAPFQQLGLIVVDEEHDPSYKQDDPAPRFHGRDSAIMRAKLCNVPIVLGSASPSVESYHNAKQGRYELFRLPTRPAGAVLPTVRLVDMRTDRLRGDLSHVSYTLKKKLDEVLGAGKQAIVFLNRRGYSPHLKCAKCGHVPSCPNCQVKLTYHKVGRKLSCHYCGFVAPQVDRCVNCESTDFLHMGVGTQKVEENIPRLFANARAVRLDSDSAAGRRKAFDILSSFAHGESNLLLGTQMVTKGLDLSNVTLVGVLSADAGLDMPDFRANERTFAMLLQVAGRSGRASTPGEVIIQTYDPENEVITDAARQDYVSFFESELKSREARVYPPFTRLINIVFSGKNEEQVSKAALGFRAQLDNLHSNLARKFDLQVLGPAPCPLYYLRGKYRRQLLIKTRQILKFLEALDGWEKTSTHFGLPSSVRISIDVDPVDMM